MLSFLNKILTKKKLCGISLLSVYFTLLKVYHLGLFIPKSLSVYGIRKYATLLPLSLCNETIKSGIY